jgi:hypothetical protein
MVINAKQKTGHPKAKQTAGAPPFCFGRVLVMTQSTLAVYVTQLQQTPACKVDTPSTLELPSPVTSNQPTAAAAVG